MDFKDIIAGFITSLIIVFKRFLQLIFTPYKTMRKISKEKDYVQIFIILTLIFIYFRFSEIVKYGRFSSIPLFSIFLIQLIFTCFFFLLLSSFFIKNLKFKAFLFTFTYSLFPTFLWFLLNSWLYIILPPPRTMSFLGKGFSIFFIAFSISILVWRVILFYLAVRFSSKLSFYKITFMMIAYLFLIIPYSYLLYYFKLFKIPFL